MCSIVVVIVKETFSTGVVSANLFGVPSVPLIPRTLSFDAITIASAV